MASQLDWLTEGSLVIRDLGYFSMEAIQNVKKRNAYYLSILKHKTILYKKVEGEFIRIDMKKLFSKMKKNIVPFIEDYLYVSTNDKGVSRVFIFLVPEKVRQERLRKNKICNKGKNYKCTDEFSIWSAFNIYITNVDQQECTIEQIAKLYKIR
jgi:hypothetical protein